MTALLLDKGLDASATPLTRRSLAAVPAGLPSSEVGGAEPASLITLGDAVAAATSSSAAPPSSYDERWLQELIFAHPELVLLDQMEQGAGAMVPLCRELAIPRLGGSVFLDVLGVTRTGRLVLVECKLWRNPQSRREVVAQVLEYAALLRGWSVGDLTARLKGRHGYAGENPIFAKAHTLWPDLDEAAFTDGVARSLALADFHLVIAGDGIRSDLQAVATHLGAQGGLARLALLEVQLWTDGAERTLVVPNVPLRTEVITQRVLLTPNGQPVLLEEVAPSGSAVVASDDVERIVDPAAATRRTDNRAFWQAVIDAARFDHPDQSPPRHGGENWIKLDLPKPFGSITAYRTGNPVHELGVFLRLRGEEGRQLYDDLTASLASLSEDSGLPLTASIGKAEPFAGTLGVTRTDGLPADEDEQRRWLLNAVNRFASAIRLRLALEAETRPQR